MDTLSNAVIWAAQNAVGLGALASIAGVVVAFLGFALAIWQLRKAQKALRAGNTYLIQKDARELMNELQDEEFKQFLRKCDEPIQFDGVDGISAGQKIAKLIQFYLSVFRQQKVGGITKPLIISMGNDFASFYKRRAIRAYFDKQREAGVYGAEHEEMVKSWVGKVADSVSAN